MGLFGTLGNAAILALACLIWGFVTIAAMIWRRQWARGPLDAVLRLLVKALGSIGSRRPF
uniref:DUF418 domain-containing protein n=1 Tax=Yoonia vestfoldensis TaxID=245188 RepID=UPI0035CA4C41